MAIIIWIVIGAIIGIGGIVVQRIETLLGRLANLAGGTLGAIGGGIAAGRGAIGDDPWRTTALIVAAAGALILVGIVNLFRHRPSA